MKNFYIILKFIVLLLATNIAIAAGNIPLDSVKIDLDDKAALQRGAKIFVNYCMGCHSASYSRYNRVASDIGISTKQLENNLIFTTDSKGERTKIGSLMKITMTEDYGQKAFGVAPPDLTVIARSHGIDWLYTYLRSFYQDKKQATGFSNKVKAVSMPNVLWQLQGVQVLDKKTNKLSLQKVGHLTPDEFDATIKDLVTFLAYLGEPVQQERKKLGAWVLLFMLFFTILAYFLKRAYWSDIH
jgi:ubiquinol-cytochrome c reductase cytochrome c1 subunit